MILYRLVIFWEKMMHCLWEVLKELLGWERNRKLQSTNANPLIQPTSDWHITMEEVRPAARRPISHPPCCVRDEKFILSHRDDHKHFRNAKHYF